MSSLSSTISPLASSYFSVGPQTVWNCYRFHCCCKWLSWSCYCGVINSEKNADAVSIKASCLQVLWEAVGMEGEKREEELGCFVYETGSPEN